MSGEIGLAKIIDPETSFNYIVFVREDQNKSELLSSSFLISVVVQVINQFQKSKEIIHKNKTHCIN